VHSSIIVVFTVISHAACMPRPSWVKLPRSGFQVPRRQSLCIVSRRPSSWFVNESRMNMLGLTQILSKYAHRVRTFSYRLVPLQPRILLLGMGRQQAQQMWLVMSHAFAKCLCVEFQYYITHQHRELICCLLLLSDVWDQASCLFCARTARGIIMRPS